MKDARPFRLACQIVYSWFDKRNFTSEEAGEWMNAPNEGLDWRTPLQALEAGESRLVQQLALQLPTPTSPF